MTLPSFGSCAGGDQFDRSAEFRHARRLATISSLGHLFPSAHSYCHFVDRCGIGPSWTVVSVDARSIACLSQDETRQR